MRLRKFIVNEASFGNKNLEKAVKLILKSLSGMVSSKFYPFGGEGNNTERFVKSNGNKGMGMIYVLDDGKLVRFNWESNKKSSTITSIDLWKDMKTPEKPNFNLDIPSDYNIVRSMKLIASFIKQPSVGLSEAKKGEYGPARFANAEKYNIDIDDPDFNKKLKKAKSEVGNVVKKITITKGVKEKSTHTESITKGNEKLKAKKAADPKVLFDDLEELIKMVGSGIQRSLLITGMAGIGKCLHGNVEIDVEFM